MKVYLGGTWNGDRWRDKLIPLLDIDYFNPIVEDWNKECRAEEIKQRETCDYLLYVITSQMKGMYSIAEVVDDSNKRPEKTLICILGPFDIDVALSFKSVCEMVKDNGGTYIIGGLQQVADFLNKKTFELCPSCKGVMDRCDDGFKCTKCGEVYRL